MKYLNTIVGLILGITLAGGTTALAIDYTQKVSGTVTATGPLTNTQLRATAVPVSGTVSISGGTGIDDGLGDLKNVIAGERSSVVIDEVSTVASTGTDFAILPAHACKSVSLANNSGTALEVRRGGAGVAYPVQTGAEHLFMGVSNSNELSIRRVDTAGTSVDAEFEAIVP